MDGFNSWNSLDFFIFLIFAVNTLLGMSRGASKELMSMMSLSIALIFAIKFTIPLSNLFNQSPLIGDVITSKFVINFMSALGLELLNESNLKQIFYSISLLICFVGIFSICEAGLSVIGAVEIFTFPYAAFNRKIGGALGAVRGYVISLIFISIFSLHLFADSGNSIFSNSFFINLLHNSAVNFDSIISGQKPDDYVKIYRDKNLYNAVDVLNKVAKPATNGIPQTMPTPASSTTTNPAPAN